MFWPWSRAQPGVFADVLLVLSSSNDRYNRESRRMAPACGHRIMIQRARPSTGVGGATIVGGKLVAGGLHIGTSYDEEFRDERTELRMTRCRASCRRPCPCGAMLL